MKTKSKHNPETTGYSVMLLEAEPPIVIVTQTTQQGRSIQKAHEEIRRNIESILNKKEFVFVEHNPFFKEEYQCLHIVEMRKDGPEWLQDRDSFEKAVSFLRKSIESSQILLNVEYPLHQT